jgi:hypothetical protein
MRKLSPFFAGLFGMVASPLLAQEAVPLQDARDGARKANAVIAAEKELPLRVEADVEKPVAIRGGAVILMVVPDKRLTPGQLGALSTEVAPVAQLWTRNASLQINGEPAKRDQVRLIDVHEDFKNNDVELYLVGARKSENGAAELLLFGKGTEPLVRIPVAPAKEGVSAQTAPIEITGRKSDENSGVLKLTFAGGQSAEIPLGRPAAQ